ncbi:MAG: tetratricopeptide repeat protein, partial [Actinomycetota bacterium]
MQIVEQTSNRLILRSYPWLSWIFGVLFTAIGVMGNPAFDSQTLTCDRRVSASETAGGSVSGRCQLEGGTFWDKTTQSFALSDLQRAEVESSSGRKKMQRVVLLIKQQSVPLNNFSSGLTNHSEQASQINTFLQNPQQPTLRVVQNINGSVLLVMGSVSGVGLLMIVFLGCITTCELDKLSGQFTLKRRGLLHQTVIKHPLQHIQGMRILESPSSKNNNTYQLNFVLTSGELIPFETYHSSGYRDKESTAQTICTFLGLEWSESASISKVGLNFLKFLSMTLRIALQRDQAVAKYREKIRLNPHNIDAHSHLAIALTMQGKHNEAQLILKILREDLLAQGKTVQAE